MVNGSEAVRIGITMGDINGIGPEVIIKALRNPKILDYCIPVIYGSGKIISYYKNIVKGDEFVYHQARSGDKLTPGKIYVINCWQENVTISIGNYRRGGRYA